MKIFEDSSTHGGGGHGELCVSVTEDKPALQILPGLRRVERESVCVCDSFSGFGEMFPCLKMYWHP